MALKIGIIGLRTLENQQFSTRLLIPNSAGLNPFCTIDPNIGVVTVPDLRLKKLAEIVNPEKIVPTTIEFVDVAGLVKGASEGEGLGNKFLSNIRECHAIAHVVRAFEDPNVVHVHGAINPKEDIEVIETELILADLKTVEKRLEKAMKDSKSGDKLIQKEAELVARLKDHLEKGRIASSFETEEDEAELLRDLHLLTMKPNLYVMNIHESQIGTNVHEGLQVPKEKVIPISAKVEEDLVGFSDEEAEQYLKDLGMAESGSSLIRSAYGALNLMTFFHGRSAGGAWTIDKGTYAQQAAENPHGF